MFFVEIHNRKISIILVIKKNQKTFHSTMDVYLYIRGYKFVILRLKLHQRWTDQPQRMRKRERSDTTFEPAIGLLVHVTSDQSLKVHCRLDDAYAY